jgi:copper chaperone CopZ
MDRITMTIDGMSCGHCVAAVTNALRSVEGVRIEGVGVGRATLAYDPAATSADRIAQAIEDEGYQVRDTVRAG